MVKTFNPKFKIKYNTVTEASIPSGRISQATTVAGFVPKEVKINKRNSIQVSYSKRREREMLKEYTGS